MSDLSNSVRELEEKKTYLFGNLIYISVFFLLLVPMVSAIPPQSTVIVNKGLQIEAPIIEYVAAEQLFKFHIHALNGSDGSRMDPNDIDCIIHIYGDNGRHIIESNMSVDSNQIDMKYDALGGNFTVLGAYAILFYCEEPLADEGGFIEYSFMVTADGLDDNFWLHHTFLLILLSTIFVIMGLMIDQLSILQFVGGMLMMVSGVLTLYPGFAYINHSTLMGFSLGISLIGIGFYCLVERGFSRDGQARSYTREEDDD